MIVLDTNVLSELMRAKPDQAVLHWVAAQHSIGLFTTTIAQAEILYGLMLLPKGKRRSMLQVAAEAMFVEDFSERILPFDSAAAHEFALLATTRRLRGHPISQFDAQIAAITKSRGGMLATRNVSDFGDCGIELFNPWEN